MKTFIKTAMPIAVIDIGTNTFNLLIAEPDGKDSFVTLFKTRVPVKLGKSGITENNISEEAFQRGIRALEKYRSIIEKHQAGKVIAFATSAVRDAKNGQRFAAEAKKRTGIEITIIDGEREAELIWTGVRNAVALGNDFALLMDIGGGSTEFIIANASKIFWKKSFRLGVTRILETFRPTDPLQEKDLQRMVQFFEEELSPLFNALDQFPGLSTPKSPEGDFVSPPSGLSRPMRGGRGANRNRFQVCTLVGSAGSFDSFGSLIAHRYYSPAIFNGKKSHPVEISDFHKLHRWLLATTLKKRLHTKGLVKFRAETIVLASLLVHTVMNRIPVSKMIISKYSLREGMLFNNNQFQV